MESLGWHVTLLQIMLLLVLLALPAVADCSLDNLTDYTLHYTGSYSAGASQVSFKDGEKAPYKCLHGYLPSSKYSGPRVLNATCRGNQWEWDSRNLQCRPVSCGHPCPNGYCRNGDVTPLVFNYPQEVTFTCNKGYHLVTHDDQYWDPHNTVYCQGNGKWSRPAPKCVEIFCPQPTPIADGKVDPPQGIFRENSTIQYACNQGFTLVGDATRRCKNDAMWSGRDPTCEQRCSEPKPLPHGEIKTNRIYEVGAIIIYVCDDGQRSSATCGEDLKWRPDPPSCTDTKRQTLASSPSPPLPTTTTTTTTTTAPLPPTPGTGTACSSPFPIPNGVVDVPPGKLDVNSKVEYRCNTGYLLVGVAERVCQMNGTWSGLEPHCQAAFPNTSCPQLSPIAHGDVTVEPGQIHVNTRAEYRCDIHYTLIGDKERFCQLNGTWSGKEPICHDANADTCPAPPSIPNGAIDVAPGPIVVRTRIEYRCHAGYALLGQSERFCQHNGSWTGAAPVCEANCPVPSPIANGDVSVPGSKLFPNIPVQYQCNVGYTLVGPQVRVCQADGTWSGSEPVCQSSAGPKNCPTPAPIANGDVDVPPGPLVVNTRVRYRCNVGYSLIGPSERSCKPDGSWTGTQPVCQRDSSPTVCPAPGSIPNGAVDLPPGTLVANAKVQYRCNVGYTLMGLTERICQPDGSWSGTEPVCQSEHVW